MGRPAGWMKELTGRRRCGRRGGRRSRRERSERCSGARSPRGVERDGGRRSRSGCRQPVGVRWFRDGGGMPSFMLAPLSGRYLSFAEREEIALLQCSGHWRAGDRSADRAVAVDDLAGAAPQRRDPRRQAGVSGSVAQWKAELVARRPKTAKLAAERAAARVCAGSTVGGWSAGRTGPRSPGPAAAWKGRNKPRREDRRWARRGARSRSPTGCASTSPMMSRCGSRHEAIYQALYVQGRGALQARAVACLRTGRALRVPRARAASAARASSPTEVMISERPAEADDRAVPGPLGRRPDHRPGPLRDRHAGRAHQPVHDAAAPAADEGTDEPR